MAELKTISVQKVRLPFVLFYLRNELYAVPSEIIREIVILPNVVAVPGVPADVRGVINLRGKVIQLVDLRMRLGMPSAKAETDDLIQLLHDREQDHRNWLTALEASVTEHKPFTMAKDPHACKFGMWYDTYKTDDNLLKMVLKKMDEPHKLIHASADAVLQLVEQGKRDEAMRLLEVRKTETFAGLHRLFDEARTMLRDHNRELAVVLYRGERRVAVSVDRVESVERIPEDSIETVSGESVGQGGSRDWRIGKRTKTNQTILILEEDLLFPPSV